MRVANRESLQDELRKGIPGSLQPVNSIQFMNDVGGNVSQQLQKDESLKAFTEHGPDKMKSKIKQFFVTKKPEWQENQSETAAILNRIEYE